MKEGFLIVPDVLGMEHRNEALNVIATLDRSNEAVMKDRDLFAVRKACAVLPALLPIVLTPLLRDLIACHCGAGAFLTKSIYFDKPASSNWFVAYHQDVSISVEQRHEVEGFTGWTAKRGMIGVVPPLGILERTLTVRMHFDDADERNGALRVMPGSHRDGIRRENSGHEKEMMCPVKAGGAMLMRPLLMHASSRSLDERPRRVLHLEFNTLELPAPLRWAERMDLS